MASLLRRRALPLAAVTAAAGGAYLYHVSSRPAFPTEPRPQARRPPPPWTPPSRADMLQKLRQSSTSDGEEFDLLVIGGGATGAGVAVDAASRGLRVALVERDDFSSGTSSKSTKLVHGGVRYLQKAVFELDYEQYKLVREALHERKIFLQTAPYLSNMLPIMLPLYKYWQVPYYWSGCKMYDFLAGGENMESSYLMSRGKALEAFPMLKSKGLVGAVVYYDGQHNDARMNMALIMTAVQHGAAVANYVEVTKLHKSDDTGKLYGAAVKDNLTGQTWNIRAKGIINATGAFTDELLTLDNKDHKPIVSPSNGVHITLPNYYSPRKMGLLDPATSDGRVIFFLPWEGNTIAGTTDSPVSLPVTRDPRPNEEEVQWVLNEVSRYLSPDIRVRRGDVLSAWAGVRPLVRDPAATGKGTQALVRNHMIYVSPTGLLTIAGGKWTTYRAMAQETVDLAVKTFGLESVARSGCITEKVRLVGSDGWSPNMFIGLIQRYGIETEIAQHLSRNYGDRAWTLLDLAEPTGLRWPLHGNRLCPLYPYTDAEVRYAVRHEYAQTAVDFLARRSRLSFLNAQAALDALPRVIEIMSAELGWSRTRKTQEIARTRDFLESMGLPREASEGRTELMGWKQWATSLIFGKPVVLAKGTIHSRAQFEPSEIERLRGAFTVRSAENRLPSLTIVEALKLVDEYQNYKAAEVQSVLEQTGLDNRTDIGLDEFLEVCAALKEVSLLPPKKADHGRRAIPVEKSGGGV